MEIKILVVEDDKTLLEMLEYNLDRQGYQVVKTENGRAALEVFDRERERISCVILDMTMPRMDGEACLAELRQRDGEVPVLLSSGYDEGELREQFAGKSPDGYVQKPYTLAKLKEQIGLVLIESSD